MVTPARRDVAGIATLVLAAAGILAGCLLLYAWDSDASFALCDPLYAALHAEEAPWSTVSGHHPLFHVLVNGATAALDAAGVARPGHLAVRLVAGLGAALVVILVASCAGRGRLRLGLLVALPLLVTRGFVMVGATGENGLPACAAALACLMAAARPGCSLGLVSALSVLALLLRQDNLLLLPAVAAVLAWRLPAGKRLRPVVATLAGVAVATVAGYLVLWRVGAADSSLAEFLFGLVGAEQTWWAQGSGPDWSHADFHLGVLGVAVAGQQWPATSIQPHIWLGVGFAGVLILASLLLRGTARHWPFLLACLLVVALRFPFFLWFEPGNYEWWLLPLVLVAACGATLAGGRPATPTVTTRRWIGGGLLVALAAAVLALHAGSSWRLRDRTLARARDEALELGGPTPGCLYLAYGDRAKAAFDVAGVPNDMQRLGYRQPAEVVPILGSILQEWPGPVVLLVDRFVGTGMPFRAPDPLAPLLDGYEDAPGERSLRERGRVRVLGWHLGGR